MSRTTRREIPPLVSRPDLGQRIASVPGMPAGTRAYTMGECRVLLSHEPKGWHISISCEDRYADWDEIAEAKYRLLPDVHMVMHLPPRGEEYVNVHPNTFHLSESREPRIAAVGR